MRLISENGVFFSSDRCSISGHLIVEGELLGGIRVKKLLNSVKIANHVAVFSQTGVKLEEFALRSLLVHVTQLEKLKVDV